jgi:uncharacterized membrane protein
MNNKFDELTESLVQSITRVAALKKCAALALALSALAFHQAGGATFTSFDFPNAIATEVNGITPSGPLMIVGDYADTSTERGYLLNNGTFTAIVFPGSLYNQAFAINTNGVIVGDYAVPSASGNGNTQRGYALAAGTFTLIDFPGAVFTTARGINSQGDIVGTYWTSYGNANIQYVPPNNTGHGFLLRAGNYSSIDFPGAVLTDVWRVTDSGQILGRYQSATDGKNHLFLLTKGVFSSVPDVPGSIETAPADVSFGALDGAGNIVGDYADQTPIMHNFRFGKANGNLRGFLLSGGVYTPIDFPGASVTVAWGLHSSGVIVGTYLDANNAMHAFIRTP